MAVTTERLIVQLEAKLDKYERNLNKASRKTDQSFTKIERRGKQFEKRFSALGGAIGAAFAGAVSLRSAQQFIDTATRIENALKVAGLEGEQLSSVYDELFVSAQKSAAPLEALVELYGKASLVQKELGVSSAELLNFTDKVAVALRVSGKSAAESSGALLQLSQALGSGVVRAEEFNSILEGALPIAQAAAAGLDEAGGSVARLRQLVVDGKVSSEAFFRAFEAGSVILENKVAGAELTTSQAFTRLANVLIKTAGKLDDATGASSRFVGVLDDVASAVEGFGNSLDEVAQSQLGGWISQVVDAYDKTAAFVKLMGGIAGTLKNSLSFQRDLSLGLEVGTSGGLKDNVQQQISDRIDQAFSQTTAKTSRLPESSEFNAPPKVDTVSLKKFSTPSSGARKSNASSRGGSSKQNDFANEISQIRERTAALQAETQVMAGLNPLVNDYGFAIEKARASQELLTAAKNANLEITPKLSSQIDQLATRYANATVESEKLAESQEKARQSAEDMNQTYNDMGSITGDIFSGIIDGSISAEDGLKRLALALVQAYLKAQLLSSIDSSTSGGSFLSGLVSSFFGGFRATGGPVSSDKAYIVGEKGPELMVPNSSGTVIPNHKLQGSRGNQAVHVTVGLVNDGLNIAQEVRSISQSEASSAVSNYSRGSLARHAKNNAELTRRTG